jgi:predicted DNA-binding helix-hairpin-helix protein
MEAVSNVPGFGLQQMDAIDKLKRLAPDTRYEPAEEVGPTGTPAVSQTCNASQKDLEGSIQYAAAPGGNRVPLLKTLVTSACERDCYYCPFRAGRDYSRVTFKPDELAKLCDQLYRRGVIEGVFLSSAIAGGGVRTQTKLIQTAEILRGRYAFEGYIHLKIMPGAEHDQIARTMQLADRVSVNLEAPTTTALTRLAPHKQLVEELIQPLLDVEKIRRSQGGVPGTWANPYRSGPSQTTMFVVGPGGETDRDLLRTTAYLRRNAGLARAYFSRFKPVPDTPLADHAPESPVRERRLYQSDFLLRDYGFGVNELVFGDGGNLPHDEDPKVVWARRHLTDAPIEINRAGKHELLRVPGIGPVGVERILRARRLGQLRELKNLRQLGVFADRAAPFILLNGQRPTYQLRFW